MSFIDYLKRRHLKFGGKQIGDVSARQYNNRLENMTKHGIYNGEKALTESIQQRIHNHYANSAGEYGRTIKYYLEYQNQETKGRETNAWQTIVKLGGEGGSITIVGKKTDGAWLFRKKTNEIFSIEDEGREEVVTKTRAFKHKKRNEYEAKDWNGFIKILESYPINYLGPISVHPEFKTAIWEYISKKVTDKDRLRRWARLCHQIENRTFELYYTIKNANHVVVLTGAGMSVESGIPDFRSQAGWWKNIDPLTVATVDAFENNYDTFHAFYRFRVSGLDNFSPHEGHHYLASWYEQNIIHHIATQNVDGFHSHPIGTKVDELHGSIRTFRCHTCGKDATKEQFLGKEKCGKCFGKLRPNVVLFGESLPEDAWANTLHHIQKADLVIVIGTSLQVYPVNQLPSITNGKKVYINKEIAKGKKEFDLLIEGSARDTLIELNKLIGSHVIT